MVFSMELAEGHLFELKVIAPGGQPLRAERALTVVPDGGLELAETADILVVPSWHDLDTPPQSDLVDALVRAHARGADVVGLCYGAYALAYAGLLDGKRAATHWMGEQDFGKRFPGVKLDMNALYVEEDGLITSAGTGAGLDCCLHIVRKYYGSKVANKVAGMMVSTAAPGGWSGAVHRATDGVFNARCADQSASRLLARKHRQAAHR